MKLNITFTLFVFAVLIQPGCGKRVDNVNELFIGDWISASGIYTLEIAENSKAKWTSHEGIATKEFTGKARIKGNKLSIGFKKLDIDQSPYIDSIAYQYRMVLSGETYIRY